MTIDEQLSTLTSSEMSQFQRICRKLLKETFIVREKNEEHRKEFYFVKHHQETFRQYLCVIGYSIVVEESVGVIMLVNQVSSDEEAVVQSGRKRFRLQETIVLCCLWLLYSDKIVSGGLTRSIIVEKAELDFQLEKFGYKNRIDKNSMKNIMTLFSRFHLAEVIGQIGEADCHIRIYPSVCFCLSETEFKRQAELAAQKFKTGTIVDSDETGGDDDE